MSDLQQPEKNMILKDPLFQRIFIFIIGLIFFLLNVGSLVYCIQSSLSFWLVIGFLICGCFAYVGMLFMLAAFADTEILNRRTGWLFEGPSADPIGLVMYILLIITVGLVIGIIALILTFLIRLVMPFQKY
ncbi:MULTISPECIES: hypothetical protein [unclassified Acinetobacter]|uniref:hypothetical protein n=1 Tax=unclassified Acinetobacter TaxID=196816 RepID=UPI001C22C125|nr:MULTISPECIES: hypothetical protein [unclassified Acinetobacter]